MKKHSHSWTKTGYNQAKCENPGCSWHRKVENFDGHHLTVYFNELTGQKLRHAPDCGPANKPDRDEVYSIKDVAGEQLNFAHLLKFENVLLTSAVLKSRRNSFGKK